MKNHTALIALCCTTVLASISRGAPSTGLPFYGAPPDEHHPWAVHDQNRPQPKRVEPGTFSSAKQPGQPPSDAIILFDGTAESLAKWESDSKEGGPTKWIAKDGAMECVPKSGHIRTREQFGDCQLHIEWAAPKNVQGDSQGRGNSGIFLMGLCEIQVLDNYNNPTYADGFAASVYGVNPPMANALRPPGQFQVIDLIFRRPIYQGGRVADRGYVTVFCNGVLMQDHTPLEDSTGHKKHAVLAPFPEKGPLKLQDHGSPVRYRNIWYRELPPRSLEGGTDGALTAEATTAKRKEIAAFIRADAAKLKGKSPGEMLRLAESLVYENDAATFARVGQLANTYVAGLQSLSSADLSAIKEEAKSVIQAFQFLEKAAVVPATFGPRITLEGIAKVEGWDQEKK